MISVIVEDKSIVINGVGAFASDNRVSEMVAPDVRAIQFNEKKGVGHIEFAFENAEERRGNKAITESDIDVDAITSLHATLVAEEKQRLEKEKDDVV